MGALAERPLNGRQIKNALQLALALARRDGAQLAQEHLDATLELTANFAQDSAADAEPDEEGSDGLSRTFSGGARRREQGLPRRASFFPWNPWSTENSWMQR